MTKKKIHQDLTQTKKRESFLGRVVSVFRPDPNYNLNTVVAQISEKARVEFYRKEYLSLEDASELEAALVVLNQLSVHVSGTEAQQRLQGVINTLQGFKAEQPLLPIHKADSKSLSPVEKSEKSTKLALLARTLTYLTSNLRDIHEEGKVHGDILSTSVSLHEKYNLAGADQLKDEGEQIDVRKDGDIFQQLGIASQQSDVYALTRLLMQEIFPDQMIEDRPSKELLLVALHSDLLHVDLHMNPIELEREITEFLGDLLDLENMEEWSKGVKRLVDKLKTILPILSEHNLNTIQANLLYRGNVAALYLRVQESKKLIEGYIQENIGSIQDRLQSLDLKVRKQALQEITTTFHPITVKESLSELLKHKSRDKLFGLVKGFQTREHVVLPRQIKSILSENLGISGEELEDYASALSRQILLIREDLAITPGESILIPGSFEYPFAERGKEGKISLPARIQYTLSEDRRSIEVNIIPEKKKKVGKGTYKTVFELPSFTIPLFRTQTETGERKRFSLFDQEVLITENSPTRLDDHLRIERGRQIQSEIYRTFRQREDIHIDPPSRIIDKTHSHTHWYNGNLNNAADVRSFPLDIKGKTSKPLKDKHKYQAIRDVSMALSEMNKLGYVHRDIKGGNIFLQYDETSDTMKGYLADFDLVTNRNEREFTSDYFYWDFLSEKGVVTSRSDTLGLAMCIGEVLIPNFYGTYKDNPRALRNQSDVDRKLSEGLFKEIQKKGGGMTRDDFQALYTIYIANQDIDVLFGSIESAARFSTEDIQELRKNWDIRKGLFSVLNRVLKNDQEVRDYLSQPKNKALLDQLVKKDFSLSEALQTIDQEVPPVDLEGIAGEIQRLVEEYLHD